MTESAGSLHGPCVSVRRAQAIKNDSSPPSKRAWVIGNGRRFTRTLSRVEGGGPPAAGAHNQLTVRDFRFLRVSCCLFLVLGRSWSRLGRSWVALGALLGVLGSLLGALGELLGRSWALLGRSWSALGSLLGALVCFWASLGRSFEVLGALGVLCGRSWVDLGIEAQRVASDGDQKTRVRVLGDNLTAS